MIGTDENRAVLHVEVIFWSGKRKIPPSLVSGKYCPHFVVIGTTEYLGVCFLDGTECTFDTPALGNAQPLYPDTIDYAPLENNAEFLIYEGANAVGKGHHPAVSTVAGIGVDGGTYGMAGAGTFGCGQAFCC